MSDIEFFAKLSPKRLTSLAEDYKSWQGEYLNDQRRFAKWGTNDPKKALLLDSKGFEEITYERFPEEA